MNELDQHVKHVLKARHYVKRHHVIDIAPEDPAILNSWYVQMDIFLKSRLGLHLHPNKKHINRADSGIDFTGFIIKPDVYKRQTSM